MRRNIINALAFGFLGGFLGALEIFFYQWEFWAIYGMALLIAINNSIEDC